MLSLTLYSKLSTKYSLRDYMRTFKFFIRCFQNNAHKNQLYELHGQDFNIRIFMLKILYKFSIKKDYYKILGVDHTASQAMIKQTYHSLAKKYHPDFNPSTEEQFKSINQAYEYLKDQQKRTIYDNENFSSNSKGERYQKSTYNTKFHYGRSQKHNEYKDNPFYEYNPYRANKKHDWSAYDYIKSNNNVHRDMQFEQNPQYYQQRKRKYKSRLIIFLGLFLIMQLGFYRERARRQTLSKTGHVYKIVDARNGRIIYTTKEAYDRIQKQMNIQEIVQQTYRQRKTK